MADILASLQKLHWIRFWSGNSPLLDTLVQRDKSFEQQFFLIAGIFPEITLDFFEDGIITAYHSKEEYDRMNLFFQTKFEENPRFIKDSLADYQERTDVDLQGLKLLSGANPENLSSDELADMFVEARRRFSYNAAIDHYAWCIEKFFIPHLEEHLKKRLSELGKEEQFSTYLALLVTPRQPNQMAEERKAFFEIVKTMKQEQALVNAIKAKEHMEEIFKKFPPAELLIERHLKAYNWLSVLVNSSPTKAEQLWEDLTHFIHHEASFEKESKNVEDAYDQTMLSEKDKVLAELSFPDPVKDLIEALEDIAFVRTEDNAIMSQLSYLVIPMYTEIARRMGVSYHEIKELTAVEVVDHLRRNVFVSPELLEDRLKLTCYVVFQGEREALVGPSAQQFKKLVEKQSETVERSGDSLFGTPASLGKVEGVAKVALSSKEAQGDMQPGDVLIAPATNADFLSAMRRAAGIVTEFGGITSHAAVVSRERKIPCVVGVFDATKNLTDGDLVDLDANKGVVKRVTS